MPVTGDKNDHPLKQEAESPEKLLVKAEDNPGNEQEAILPAAQPAASPADSESAIEAESDVAAAETGASPEAAREVPKPKQQSMGKTFGIVAVLTVLSKVIGLVRDIVVAHAYGTGIIADAWNYAYLFTGNILILFGGLGGPYHSATVAILTPRKDSENAGKLLTQIALVTFISLTAVCLLACLLSPFIASLALSQYKIVHANLPPELAGWTDVALKNLLQNQVREQFLIMAPLIVISGLVGISYGILNVYNKIFWPSLSPAIASVAIIVAIWGFYDPTTAAYTGIPLALGTLVGALGQLFAQTPDIIKSNLKWKFTREKQEGIDEYSAMIWPAIFSTSVGQLIVYVDAFFTGTLGQGSWTAVLMSNRLVQLPLGVLLTAMLVPILPRFTQLVDAGNMDELKEELRRSLRFLCFLAFPMAALFLAIPSPIIRLLFQHGEFNNESTGLVTIALIFLAPSILFYVARDLMTRVFYAFKDSKTPFHVALVAIVVKAFLDWLFVFVLKMDVRGISLASTLITILNLTLLSTFLKNRIGLLGFHKLLVPLGLMMLASVLCAGSAFGVTVVLEAEAVKAVFASILPKTWSASVLLLIEVGLSCAVAAVVYFLACILFKLDELNMLVRRVPALGRILKR